MLVFQGVIRGTTPRCLWVENDFTDPAGDLGKTRRKTALRNLPEVFIRDELPPDQLHLPCSCENLFGFNLAPG